MNDTAAAKSLNQLYVLVVCVLVLVQDSAVTAVLCKGQGQETSMHWYRERPMESVSTQPFTWRCPARTVAITIGAAISVRYGR